MPKITVNEAMSLKKELAPIITRYRSGYSSASRNIQTIENGVDVSPVDKTFSESYSELEILLARSLEINDKLAVFNAQNGVDSLVRRKKNLEVLNILLDNVIKSTKPGITKSFMPVGNERVEVIKETIALVPVVELEIMRKKNRKEIAKIQAEIFKLNAQEIELSFDDSDL